MSISRRTLLKSGTLAAAGAALTPTVSARPTALLSPEDTRNMHLSLAAYSVREALTSGEMDLFGFIDWCAELGLPGTELTSYYFPDEFDDDYLHELRLHAFANGVTISGTAIRNDFCRPAGPEKRAHIEHTKRWIDHAAEFFAPHIRIFAGNLPDGVNKATGIQWVAEGIREVLEYAAERGVVLGLENHGGITARAADHLAIVDAVGEHPWFGVNLDTGNFRTNAYEELAMAAPHAVNVQVKVLVHQNDGTEVQTDLERIRDILVDANYRGWVVLEYEEENPLEQIPAWLDRMREVFWS
ncbi:MAG: sugar phosphate isomerase/epimerase family protein [Rhodothermales bacterium]